MNISLFQDLEGLGISDISGFDNRLFSERPNVNSITSKTQPLDEPGNQVGDFLSLKNYCKNINIIFRLNKINLLNIRTKQICM